MATHNVNRQWLPTELHDTIWSDLTDPSSLEVGDWVFDPSNGSFYAGQVIEISIMDYVRIKWYKTVLSRTIANVTKGDNVFEFSQTYSQLSKMWWLDPCVSNEEDD